MQLTASQALSPLPLWLLPAALQLVMGLIAFAMMGADKRKAKAGVRRTPEKTLFLVALLFGGVGGTLGMWCFRHKTKHTSFAIGFPLLALSQLALTLFIAMRF